MTIGVLNSKLSLGAKGGLKTFESHSLDFRKKGWKLKVIEKIDESSLKGLNVLIISHGYDHKSMNILRKAVARGMGVLLTHDASGSGRGVIGQSSFPELVTTAHKSNGYMSPNPRIKPLIHHPLTEGIDMRGFNHTYWDHTILLPVDQGNVLMVDSSLNDGFNDSRFRGTQARWDSYFGGNAVLVAGQYGKGRVVLCGLLLGWNRKHQPMVINGAELQLLENCVNWLSGKGTFGLSMDTALTSGYEKASAAKRYELPDYQPNSIRLVSSGASSSSKGQIVVKISYKGDLAEISTRDFSVVVGVESQSDTPTIQSLKVRDFNWHRTWKGLERNSLTSPVLRLSDSLIPFDSKFPSFKHELGKRLPDIDGVEKVMFGKVVLAVGTGRISIDSSGMMELNGFKKKGRISTNDFDGYLLSDGKWVEESVSYDQPKISGGWLWAVKRDSFAIGGEFVIGEKMGVTGLSPGVERNIQFIGNRIVVTTTPWGIFRKSEKTKSGSVKNAPTLLRPRRVLLKRLCKMRGGKEYFPILPRPVEIYLDEIGNSAEKERNVVKWELLLDNCLVATDPSGVFSKSIEDADVVKATRHLDPDNEDKDVWRRFFIKYSGKKFPFSARGMIIGVNSSGKSVLKAPLSVSAVVSAPMGVLVYDAQWVNQEKITPRSQWPKLMRDVALRGLDYVMFDMCEYPKGYNKGENAERIERRLKRYGLWCLASLHAQPIRKYHQSGTLDPKWVEELYSKVIRKYADEGNIIAWYLSDELACGKPGDKNFERSYAQANNLYEIFKKLNPRQWGINLISRSATPHEVAAANVKTDVFDWDPYGIGANSAFDEAALVNRIWRKAKGKPAWITLRCCGPNFYDTLDLWLDIRRRSAAAYRGGVDGINYFMYAHWMKNLERYSYYAVFPGTLGPVSTPRWQALGEVSRDLELSATAEWLLASRESDSASLKVKKKKLETALHLGQQGKFFQMREILRALIREISEGNSGENKD